MKFNYKQRREGNSFAQRSVAMGTRGMVSSSQYLASLSGYKVLQKGGNAIDAAASMSLTLSVVEPQSTGIGGDAFAMIYMANEDKLIGMNASGRAPIQANMDWFEKQGIQAFPERGILPVTVPGALQGFVQAAERYGRLSVADLFEDAIFYAENGFPVTEITAGEWKFNEEILRSQKSSSDEYLINGKAPKPEQVFRNKGLAQTYRKIVRDGVDTFYGGAICEDILRFSEEHGGLLSRKDFENHTTSWSEPISTDYRDYTVFELPPNGQGITALEMLNILEGYDIRSLGA